MDPHHLRSPLERRRVTETVASSGEFGLHLLGDRRIELHLVSRHHDAESGRVARLLGVHAEIDRVDEQLHLSLRMVGTIRATLFGSRGRYREATLDAGDVGYIPQGYGHSLENVGPGTARVLIVFNSGTYQTIDISQWIAGQPADVLAVNFGKPTATFEDFPKRDVFIAGS